MQKNLTSMGRGISILLLPLCFSALAFAGCRDRRTCCQNRDLTCFSLDVDTLDVRSHTEPQVTTTAQTPRTTPSTSTAGYHEHPIRGPNSWHIHVDPDRVVSARDYNDLRSFFDTLRSTRFAYLRMPSNDTIASNGTAADFEALLSLKNLVESGQVQILDSDPMANAMSLKRIGRLIQRKRCYCDEACPAIGDCCADYTSTCPVRDCEMSVWSGWGGCEKNSAQDPCIGISKRERRILRPAAHGGKKCSNLEEIRHCYGICSQLLQEEALLLPYDYAEARVPGYKNSVYYDLPRTITQINSMNSYCITYEVKWLDEACRERGIREDLREGAQVCVECQPSVQLTHPDQRCRGEGDETGRTFWRVNGDEVAHCRGAWVKKKLQRPCTCRHDHFQYPAYLFV